MSDKNRDVTQDVTNESLNAIVTALSPMKGDRILSICGTGDVPFAFLTEGGMVDAVDIDGLMISEARRRLSQIQEGDYRGFLGVKSPWAIEESNQRSDFFSPGVKYTFAPPEGGAKLAAYHYFCQFRDALRADGTYLRMLDIPLFGPNFQKVEPYVNFDFSNARRLNRLRENSGGITFYEGNILDFLGKRRYSRAWLSNIIGYKEQEFDFAARILSALSTSLISGGLFYSTLGNRTGEFIDRMCAEGIIPEGTFKLNPQRTKLAARIQADALQRIERAGGSTYTWNPRVYQKV
jgi:hypothetical protein